MQCKISCKRRENISFDKKPHKTNYYLILWEHKHYFVHTGTYKGRFSVLLIIKTWNLVSVLNIDDMASLSKFGEVMWPSLHLKTVLYFTDDHFAPI